MEAFSREVMAPYRRPREFRKVVVNDVDEIFAVDLADMVEVMAHNDGYRYILVVVDVFSRYAWCYALQNKAATTVWEAIGPLMAEHHPKFLWADKGGEFYNAFWAKKLKALKTKIYSTYGDSKVSIAERFIRTIKTSIWQHFLQTGKRRWIDVLPSIVSAYNARRHTTLKMSPTQAREKTNFSTVFALHHAMPSVGKPPKFRVGDFVRIPYSKEKFEKGFHPTFSYEVYSIASVRASTPNMYYLKDAYGEPVIGGFYESQLTPVADGSFFPIETVLEEKKVGRKKMALVKYLGYEKPEWVDARDMEDI